MSRPSIFRIFWRRLYRGTGHLLNLLLSLLALGQTSLILLNNLNREIPVPDLLARPVISWSLHKTPFHAEWLTLVFDLQGGFFFKDFALSHADTGETLFSAETFGVDTDPLSLALGHALPIESLAATRVRLFTSAKFAPTGLNEAVLFAPQLRVFQDNGRLVIEESYIESENLRLYFRGAGPAAILDRPAAHSPAWKLDQALALIQKIPEETVLDCLIDWNWSASGSHSVSSNLFADSVTLPFAALGPTLAEADFEADASGSLALLSLHLSSSLIPDRIPGLAPYIGDFLSNQAVPLSLSLSGPESEWNDHRVPSRLRAHLRSPFSRLPQPHSFLLQADLSTTGTRLLWSLRGHDLFASGTTSLPFLEPAASASPLFSFRAYFREPALHDFFPELPQTRLLQDTRAAFLRFNGSFLEESLSGSFVCDHLLIGQTPFAHIHAGIVLSPDDLLLDPVYVVPASNEAASGSYFHHFASSRFSLNATGSILPDTLDPLLGQWWSRIFTQIQIEDPLPADVTVWGLWRDETSWRSVTAVTGGTGWYRGVQIPSLWLKIRSNSQWVYLEELEARFPEGGITGEMAWQQGIREGEPRPIRIDFESDAPWPVVQEASGLRQLADIWVEGRPEVSARGLVWTPPKGFPEAEAPASELEFSMESVGKRFHIGNLHLDALTLDGAIEAGKLAIHGMSGRFAEGVFTANLQASGWDRADGGSQTLEVRLFDANYQEAMKRLESLMEDDDRLEPLYREDKEGRLDADFRLELEQSLEESRGHGQVTLRRGRIGQIHLFGGLSRLFANIGLGFSTLDLNAATVQWKLEDGIVDIPECVITGSVLNLNMWGRANLMAETLNLQGEAFLFSGTVSKLLSPLSDNFQFDITGSFQNPDWRLRVNPLRWFQNRLDPREGRDRRP